MPVPARAGISEQAQASPAAPVDRQDDDPDLAPRGLQGPGRPEHLRAGRGDVLDQADLRPRRGVPLHLGHRPVGLRLLAHHGERQVDLERHGRDEERGGSLGRGQVGDALREQRGHRARQLLQERWIGEEPELVEVDRRALAGGQDEVAVELGRREQALREVVGHRG